MKAAVYAGTRNVYEDMIPSMKSLLIHSDVDKIYFLIEDDEFPYELPPEVECINVSEQKWFTDKGVNYNSSWSYMILLRAVYPKIFPHLDIILSLDNDTIVNENISDIWELPIENYYFAAAKEPIRSTEDKLYTNIGVTLFNLKKFREDKLDDKIIIALNEEKYNFPEQDVLNKLCQGFIYELPSDYNVSNYTDIKNIYHRKINHYARVKQWRSLPLVNKYRNLEIKRNIRESIGLDIIIPAYNNLAGLKVTLDSVYYPELKEKISITVVDDASQVDYSDLLTNYPDINYIKQPQNAGPGVARQTGIQNTSRSHILFVDCGDKIFSKYSLLEILDVLHSNTTPDLYLWTWVNGEWNTISGKNSMITPGYVYKREFLELYHITYSTEGSYSNEDFGFNRSCSAVLTYMASYDKTPHKLFFETPIYKMIYDKDSITHKNNGEYMLTTHLNGFITNCKHVVKTCIRNNFPRPLIQQELNSFIVRIHTDFIRNVVKKSPYLQQDWENMYNFYNKVYLKYNAYMTEKNIENLQLYYSRQIQYLIKMTQGKVRINLGAFMRDLGTTSILPERYKL